MAITVEWDHKNGSNFCFADVEYEDTFVFAETTGSEELRVYIKWNDTHYGVLGADLNIYKVSSNPLVIPVDVKMSISLRSK